MPTQTAARMAASRLLLAALALLASHSAAAAEIQTLTVDRDGKRYSVQLLVALDTSAERAFAVMHDYANLGAINPAIQSVVLLDELPDGGRRVQTAVKVCVLLFCRMLEQVQDMHAMVEGSTGRISARVLPEFSNLRHGLAQWIIVPCSDARQACLEFTATIEPDFWVPPLIGPWAIKNKLREEAVQTSLGIETVANARP